MVGHFSKLQFFKKIYLNFEFLPFSNWIISRTPPYKSGPSSKLRFFSQETEFLHFQNKILPIFPFAKVGHASKLLLFFQENIWTLGFFPSKLNNTINFVFIFCYWDLVWTNFWIVLSTSIQYTYVLQVAEKKTFSKKPTISFINGTYFPFLLYKKVIRFINA